MKALVGFFGQIILLVIISSIETAQGAVNYKLTSVVNDFEGNLSAMISTLIFVIILSAGYLIVI
jgi:hypothetical protein